MFSPFVGVRNESRDSILRFALLVVGYARRQKSHFSLLYLCFWANKKA
jgi:hypothetical protein